MMYPLAHLITEGNSAFRSYVSQKTGYLLSDMRPEQLLHFWVFLIRQLDARGLRNTLSEPEKNALHELLGNFGFLAPSRLNEEVLELEKNLHWIFRHPDGGIFVPLEIIKTLMKSASITGEKYLFHRFADMRYSEQQAFAVFILSGIKDKSNMLSIERSPADMALVLYIWFSNLHAGGYAQYPYRGKLLNGPHSFLREGRTQDVLPGDLFPTTPRPLWKHLFQYYPHLGRDIEELQDSLLSGGKGFFRALLMLTNPRNEFAEAIRLGYLLPVFPRGAFTEESVRKMKVVTSPEMKHCLMQNELARSTAASNRGGDNG